MTLTIGLLTTHLFCRVCNDGFIDSNQLLAIEGETHAVATMINSYDRRSFIIARKSEPVNGFGFYFGAATGYYDYYADLIPVAAPYYEYGNFKATMMTEAIALSYSVKLW